MSGQDGQTPGRRRPRAEGLLGKAAQPTAPRPARPGTGAPTAVRRAALVVAVEALALTALALTLLVLTLTGSPDSVGRALAEVVYVGLGAALLAAAAVGLWRVSGWARGPVIVLQILLGLLAYNAAFEAQQPLIGLPVLALVATELWLLATPEARLAFFER
ncbi:MULTISPECIES: hypothetical protein [unclassified Modestobacter]|uniref:hypothetical protein n=1 Tax=unclassified Modestobacter TaxID=2643866 RepID=UPI0022AA8564|nr:MULTISPECIES: hypothetical protein [unclassified Modestobacter]MCZ2823921.1 hypothetical protein [Modestobacter sp. VKM Ac-2981]MCZ2852166.1 hypothetical protein [Modestobacter sp. VKM Ac-2982]